MFVNVLCTIKHFRRRKASRSVIILYCNAEAAGFEPANRLRAVNCFRGSLLQPLGHASCLYWDSVPNYLNSPIPLFKGAIRACGLSIAAGLPCSPAPSRHLMMPCYLTLRAAFASSTYLLSQIPGPGRSSDDDLLNPPDPVFKGAHQAFVRTRARGHRFAVLRPASDDALVP